MDARQFIQSEPSPPASYQSINVSVNGVVKNLIIPVNSLPAATRLPRPITVQPATQDVLTSAAQTTVVSSLPRPPQILALNPASTGQPADPATGGSSGGHPKLTSILSAVRFQSGGRRTLLAIRPKGVSAAATAATATAEAGKAAATVTRPVTAGEQYSPVVRALRPGMKITAVPMSGGGRGGGGGGGETGGNVSIIRPAQLVRSVTAGSVIRQPGSTAGNPRIQYVIQPGTKQVVPSSGAVIRPKTITVKALGVNDGNAKKMVMIRVPGGGSSETNAALGALQLKPGHAWVEVKDSKSKTIRYIQMRKKETAVETEPPQGRTVEAGPLSRAATSPPPATEEGPSMAEDVASEDIKVIEIVPDEDDDDDDEELIRPVGVPGKSEKEETETDGKDIFKAPRPVIGQPDLLPGQDSDNFDGSSGSLRPGIFEALKNMSLEEATAAASALKIPGQQGHHREQEDFTIADNSMNIVHRGDDHMIIENPKYSEDDDDDEDDDECTISAEEPSHDSDLTISEPHSLAASPRKLVRARVPAGTRRRSPGKTREQSGPEGKRRNVARRTGGRPGVPQEGTARRSGGRPMTIKERYGVDVVECYVLLDRKVTNNSAKPYTKWVEQHLGQIVCRIKKRVVKKPDMVKTGTEGSRPLERSETDDKVVLKEPIDKKIAIKDCSYVDAATLVGSGGKRNAEKFRRIVSDSAIEFGGTAAFDMGPIVVRKRTPRQKVKTDETPDQTEDNTELTKADGERSVEQSPVPGPAKRRRVWSRRKLPTDGEDAQASAAGLQVKSEIVPTGSNSNTNNSSSGGIRRRRARKPPKGDLPDIADQDGNATGGLYPSKLQRRRRVKRRSEPVDLGEDQSEWSTTPVAANEGESGAKKRRRRRRRESSAESRPVVTAVGTLDDERSSVLNAASEDLRRKISMKKSLLKPVAPFSPATGSSHLNANMTTGSRLSPSPTSPPPPIRGPMANYRIIAGESKSSTLTPPGARPRASLDQTKYYLVKTQKGSFLIPVPGTSSNQTPVPMAVSVPIPPTVTPSSSLPKSPADEAAGAAGEEHAKSDSEDGGTYEPAVAGMRQEDRISLLKEKLRQQQALLAKMKKK